MQAMDKSSSKKSGGGSKGKEKKLKRKEELAKKRATEDLVKAACAKENVITEFPPFLKLERNDLKLKLEGGHGEHLPASIKAYIQHLCKVNMELHFGDDWSTEERNKRREMASPEARYIFLRKVSDEAEDNKDNCAGVDIAKENDEEKGLWTKEWNPLVGFVQFRFVVDHDLAILYVYEIQLESAVQRKGLGKFLMQFLELIARKNRMQGVLLTVQKHNSGAMQFYTSNLRYMIASVSPSRWDSLAGGDANYEILCKTFDPEAKAILEEGVTNP